MLIFDRTSPLAGNQEARYDFASGLQEKGGGTAATLTRAGTGYYQPSFSRTASASTNVSRHEQSALLVESASTNYALYNQDFSNAAWGKSNLTAATDTSITDPEGGTGAWKLTADAGGASSYIAQVLGTNCRAMSVWMKKGNVSSASVSMYASGTETSEDGLLNVTLTDEWQRIVVDRMAACNVIGMFVNADVVNGSASAGDYIYVYIPGAYNSGRSTDIKTVAAGVTRVTDAVTIPAAYTPTTFTTTFTIAFDLQVLTDTGAVQRFLSIGNTLGTSIRLINAVDDRFRLFYGTADVSAGTGTLVYGHKYRIVIAANGTNFKLFVDWSKIGETAIAGTAGFITTTNINPNTDAYFRISNYVKYDNYIDDGDIAYA